MEPGKLKTRLVGVNDGFDQEEDGRSRHNESHPQKGSIQPYRPFFAGVSIGIEHKTRAEKEKHGKEEVRDHDGSNLIGGQVRSVERGRCKRYNYYISNTEFCQLIISTNKPPS